VKKYFIPSALAFLYITVVNSELSKQLYAGIQIHALGHKIKESKRQAFKRTAWVDLGGIFYVHTT